MHIFEYSAFYLNGRPIRSVLVDSDADVAPLLLRGEVGEGELDRGEVLPVLELLPGELQVLPGLEGDPGRRQPRGRAGNKDGATNNLRVSRIKIKVKRLGFNTILVVVKSCFLHDF